MGRVTLASDNFNRANSLNLGANWTVSSTSQSAIQIVSNQIQPITVNIAAREDYSAIVWSANHWSEATLIASASTTTNGLRVRSTPTLVSALLNSYEFIFPGATGVSKTVTLRKIVNSVTTNLATASITTNVNDVFRLEVQGTTLRCFQNGTQIMTTTDSDLSTGDPGLTLFFSGGAASQAIMDNWSGGIFSNNNNRLMMMGAGT